jgi:hypothetical protein
MPQRLDDGHLECASPPARPAEHGLLSDRAWASKIEVDGRAFVDGNHGYTQ